MKRIFLLEEPSKIDVAPDQNSPKIARKFEGPAPAPVPIVPSLKEEKGTKNVIVRNGMIQRVSRESENDVNFLRREKFFGFGGPTSEKIHDSSGMIVKPSPLLEACGLSEVKKRKIEAPSPSPEDSAQAANSPKKIKSSKADLIPLKCKLVICSSPART